jgi:GAF domain-containing protein
MLLTREQLQERLIALHRASLELMKVDSLEHLLERIAATALEQAGASYAALGVLDENGGLRQFISVGMSKDDVTRIAHPPVGEGLIGALMKAKEPIRVPVIKDDPRSVGFPKIHPQMTSFLGVPIRAGEVQLGQIYLTDKVGEPEFTADDERIIQMLAGYAAAAIQNARLLEQMKARDRVLTRRSEDLALLNDIASVLTGSLELDEILNKTLAVVMNYIKMEAGEIFLLDDDKETLRMVLHRGQAAEAFWTRTRVKVGEGIVGGVAKSGQPRVSTDLVHESQYLRPAVVEAGFRQIACLPMKSAENLIGVISVATRSEAPLDERGIQLGWPGHRKRPASSECQASGRSRRARSNWHGSA